MQKNHKLIKILAFALIVWNIIDVGLHIGINMAEPLRLMGNALGLFAGILILIKVSKVVIGYFLGISIFAVTVLNLIHSTNHGYVVPMLVFIGVSQFLLLVLLQRHIPEESIVNKSSKYKLITKWWFSLIVSICLIVVIMIPGKRGSFNFLSQLHNGELVAADIWRDEPMILSAGMGFDNIIGVPEVTEEIVKEAGGSWYGSLTCQNGEEASARHKTTVAPSNGVTLLYKGYADYDDGLPVVFSWPVATETVDVTDFMFTLNTGEQVYGHSVGMSPNWELNERNTVVLFGDFGNRGKASEPDAVFPVKLTIVEDETPLLLIGPGGQEFNAVGLTWTTDKSPYDAGPVLCGAKLNLIGEEPEGEGGIQLITNNIGRNDEFALYDEGDFRLRILTTGGFSPDGVTPLTPDRYEDFFRIHVKGANGETVLLEKVGVDYEVAGGSLRVVGLSDLGNKENPAEGIYYDACYAEDRDNYIDIILVGDVEAARNVTFVEIPGLEGGYNAFYNPGGPGPEPYEGVRYTAPGPPDMEPVMICIDDPMRVSREPVQ